MNTKAKQPASTLFDEMNNCHITGNHRNAVIVFDQCNFSSPYNEESRSYVSNSDQWGWDYNKMGNCRVGDCLDGSENGVRLDWCNWKIEYWYWKD